MKIKYMGRSGRIVTEEELRQIYNKSHPNGSDIQFDIWLYMGIECNAIKVIKD